jgi:hypothetical protein
MDAERWDRLVTTLAERGRIEAEKIKVTAKPYPGGVSRSIILRTTDGDLVEVYDTWWKKNDKLWTGWQVCISDRDSIITRLFPKVKARGPVADHVREALAGKTLR